MDGKTAFLRDELKGLRSGKHNMLEFEKPLTCPLDPTVKLYGVKPESCNVFKSAVQPMKMTFNSRKFAAKREDRNPNVLPELGVYSIVFKNGDDTRQD